MNDVKFKLTIVSYGKSKNLNYYLREESLKSARFKFGGWGKG